MKKLALIALISMFATSVFAHSGVDITLPANGEILAETPVEISFKFTKDIRLTRVEMTHQDDPTVTLELSEHTSFGREFSLPFEEMGVGVYRIDWRGLRMDGHAVQGSFSFTVE